MLDLAPPELIVVLIGLTFATTFCSSVVNCRTKKKVEDTTGIPNPPKASELKPQVIPKNEKEELIALGQLKRGKHDYPTMDDVVSDWETEEEGVPGDGQKKEKKKAKEPKSKMGPAPKSKVAEPSGEGVDKLKSVDLAPK